MQPVDFSHARMEDWAFFVLDAGLPALPEEIAIGEAVPIACWAGSEMGAVMFVIRYEPDDSAEDGEPHVDVDIHCFHRTGDGWDQANGDGGSDWPLGIELRRQDVPAGKVTWEGVLRVGDDGWACQAIDGMVGMDAAWVEVETSNAIDRRPINAPLGAFVVCVPDPIEATLRVCDSDGNELGRRILNLNAA